MLWWWSAIALAVPLELEVGTRFPLDVGAGTRVEWPGRVQTGARVGVLPGPYVDAINATVMAFGGYNDATADVIRSAIGRSLVASLEVGWRPVRSGPASVLSVQAGYTLATLGGQATGLELVAAAYGVDPPPSVGGVLEFDLGATVHLLRPEVVVAPRLTGPLHLVAGVGGAFTVGARASMEPSGGARLPGLQEAYAEGAESWLEETLRRYVHTPTVRLGLAWRIASRDR